jgi:chromosomal replication initiator protein
VTNKPTIVRYAAGGRRNVLLIMVDNSMGLNLMANDMNFDSRAGLAQNAAHHTLTNLRDTRTETVTNDLRRVHVSATELKGDTLSPGTALTVTANGGEVLGLKVRTLLRAQLGDEIFNSWFNSLEIDQVDGEVVRASVPVKFLRNWIQSHYAEQLLRCCQAEFKGVQRVEVVLRTPGAVIQRATVQQNLRSEQHDDDASIGQRATPARAMPTPHQRTQVGAFEGSPLDPRYTFDSFVIGASNRMSHAGATQVAETIFSETRSFNPLFIHSTVGLGKTHLLHAIAWDVKRRTPHAQVLYLTAERFRYQFVEALRSSDPMAFKDKFRSIDLLLIDDLEFLHGHQTEQEFDHIINSLLDGGKQVVVASARAPNQIEKLNERMRSRLTRGLVTELGALDYDLRLRVLEKRMAEKRQMDPSFEMGRDVLELLADKLTESGRELEGAITRLHATWQYMKTPIKLDIAETVIRDLVQGAEPKRIKIEDIIKTVSRHFGVSKGDILSQRRHRSVVWPRQIGMYLSKQMTTRSLPEIGRRFGNRDHTTVLHAIRKIDGCLTADAKLKDELEDLKRQIGN